MAKRKKARKRKVEDLSDEEYDVDDSSRFEHPPGTYDLSAGDFRTLGGGLPRRSEAELLALRRALDLENPPEGLSTRPALRDLVAQLSHPARTMGSSLVSGGGWGTPIRGHWVNEGTKKNPHWVWHAIPAAVVGAIIASLFVWGFERVSVDAWNNFPGSALFGKARPVASYPTWIASWLIPSGGDIHTASATIQSLGSGTGPGQPPPASSSLPGWLQAFLSWAGITVTRAANPTSVTVALSQFDAQLGAQIYQWPDGSLSIAGNFAQSGVYYLAGGTPLGTSVTIYPWPDGTFRTTVPPAGILVTPPAGFPTNPYIGQVYYYGGVAYTYTQYGWMRR